MKIINKNLAMGLTLAATALGGGALIQHQNQKAEEAKK